MVGVGDGHGRARAEEDVHDVSDDDRDGHDGPGRSFYNIGELRGEKVKEEQVSYRTPNVEYKVAEMDEKIMEHLREVRCHLCHSWITRC
jgi:hypothetical protein